MRFRLPLAAILSCWTAVLAAQDTVWFRVPVAEEATVSSLDPSARYTTGEEWLAMAWDANGLPFALRTLVRFDYAGLPAEGDLLAARLHLHPAAPHGPHPDHTGDNASVLQRVSAPWTGQLVDWHAQPAAALADAVFLDAVSPGQSLRGLDVTGLVAADRAPGAGHGLLLQLQSETGQRTGNWAGSGHPDSARRPLLEVGMRLPEGWTGMAGGGVPECPLNVRPNPDAWTLSWASAHPCTVEWRRYRMDGAAVDGSGPLRHGPGSHRVVLPSPGTGTVTVPVWTEVRVQGRPVWTGWQSGPLRGSPNSAMGPP